jgi:hypothetical protein
LRIYAKFDCFSRFLIKNTFFPNPPSGKKHPNYASEHPNYDKKHQNYGMGGS